MVLVGAFTSNDTVPFNGPLSETTQVRRYQKKHSPTHTCEEGGFAQTTRSAFSQWGLLDPIKPAYNQSRPDGRFKLTASAFNRLWISMLAFLSQYLLLCRTHCIFYQLPPLLFAIFWVLWCRERQQRQMHWQSVWMPPYPDYRCPCLHHTQLNRELRTQVSDTSKSAS